MQFIIPGFQWPAEAKDGQGVCRSLSMRDHARFRSRKTGKPFDFIHLTVSLGIPFGGIWRVNEDVGEAGNLVL